MLLRCGPPPSRRAIRALAALAACGAVTAVAAPAEAQATKVSPAAKVPAGKAPGKVVPPPPRPAPKPLGASLSGQALADYTAGRALFAAGNATEALGKFEAAYLASKDPRLLWNMAACEKARKRYASATVMLEHYRSEGAGLLSAADLARAAQLMAVFAPSVGALAIASNEEGAAVVIDGEDTGSTPLAGPVPVDRGTRTVTVTKAGFVAWSQTVSVTSATPVAVEVALVREPKPVEVTAPAPEPPPPPPPPPVIAPEPAPAAALAEPVAIPEARPERSGGLGTTGWLLIGAGGALVLGGTIAAVAAASSGAAPTPPVAGSIPPGSIALPLLP